MYARFCSHVPLRRPILQERPARNRCLAKLDIPHLFRVSLMGNRSHPGMMGGQNHAFVRDDWTGHSRCQLPDFMQFPPRTSPKDHAEGDRLDRCRYSSIINVDGNLISSRILAPKSPMRMRGGWRRNRCRSQIRAGSISIPRWTPAVNIDAPSFRINPVDKRSLTIAVTAARVRFIRRAISTRAIPQVRIESGPGQYVC